MTREEAIQELTNAGISSEQIMEIVEALATLQPTCNQLATDCISRQAAIDEVIRLHDTAWVNWKETRISANTMIDALKDLLFVQPERPKGEWIEIMDADEFGNPYPCGVRCSECGFCSVNLDNFCPNCGAKMEVEHE